MNCKFEGNGKDLSFKVNVKDGCSAITKLTVGKAQSSTYYQGWKGEKYGVVPWAVEPSTCKIDYAFDTSANDYDATAKA